jgi:hypothetical protein
MHCACVQRMLNSHQHVRRCTSPPLRATQICILVCTYLTIWVCKNVYMCYTRLLVCSVVPSVLVVSCSTVHSRREWGEKERESRGKVGIGVLYLKTARGRRPTLIIPRGIRCTNTPQTPFSRSSLYPLYSSKPYLYCIRENLSLLPAPTS